MDLYRISQKYMSGVPSDGDRANKSLAERLIRYRLPENIEFKHVGVNAFLRAGKGYVEAQEFAIFKSASDDKTLIPIRPAHVEQVKIVLDNLPPGQFGLSDERVQMLKKAFDRAHHDLACHAAYLESRRYPVDRAQRPAIA